MFFYFISEKHADKLCNTSQNQISMKCFRILGFATSNPKAVFQVIDGTFYSGSDLICIIPFVSPAHSAGIST